MTSTMLTYELSLESGPRRRKTMVHVLDLLGCIATGPTTEEALDATPAAIERFRRYLAAHGEDVDPGAPFETRVAEHITEGDWLGNGSPYLVFAADFAPLDGAELETLTRRFEVLYETLASWAAARTDAELDEAPAGGGRTARAILLHVAGAPGGYLSAALGGATGFSAAVGAAERGEIDPATTLRRVAALGAARLRATTPAERRAVRVRPKDRRTLRKAVRRMLEHGWEHLVELARRPGGPAL